MHKSALFFTPFAGFLFLFVIVVGMALDFGKLARETFLEWWKNPRVLKFVLLAFLLHIIVGTAILLAGIGTLGLDNALSMGSKYSDSSIADAGIAPGTWVVYLGLIVVLTFLSMVVLAILNAFIGAETLAGKNLSPEPMNLRRALKLILFSIYQSLVIFFLWKDKRFTAIPVALIVLGIVAIFLAVTKSWIALLVVMAIWILILIPYVFLSLYHSLRLLFSGIYWLSGNRNFSQALEDSWQSTRGNVWNLIIAELVVSVVFVLVILVPSIIVGVIQFVAEQSLDTGFMLGSEALQILFNALMYGFLLGFNWAWLTEVFVQLRGTAKP